MYTSEELVIDSYYNAMDGTIFQFLGRINNEEMPSLDFTIESFPDAISHLYKIKVIQLDSRYYPSYNTTMVKNPNAPMFSDVDTEAIEDYISNEETRIELLKQIIGK